MNGEQPIIVVVPPCYGSTFAMRRTDWNLYRCVVPSVKSLYPMELTVRTRYQGVIDGTTLTYSEFFKALAELPAECIVHVIKTGGPSSLETMVGWLMTNAVGARLVQEAGDDRGFDYDRDFMIIPFTPYQTDLGHLGYLGEPQGWIPSGEPKEMTRWAAGQKMVWVGLSGVKVKGQGWDVGILREVGAWAKGAGILWGLMGGAYPDELTREWIEVVAGLPDTGAVVARVTEGPWLGAAHLAAAGLRVAYPSLQAGSAAYGLREAGVVDSEPKQAIVVDPGDPFRCDQDMGRRTTGYLVPVRLSKLFTGTLDPIEEAALAAAKSDPECCGVFGENLGYVPPLKTAVYFHVPSVGFARRGWKNLRAAGVPAVPAVFDGVRV